MSDLQEPDKKEEHEQNQPPSKKLRITDVENGNEDKNKVLLKLVTNALLYDSSDSDSDSDDDDLESLLSYYMTKKIQKRKRNSLLKRLLKSGRQSADEYEKKDYLEDVVPSYTEKQFLENFRITRSLYQQLCKSYAESDWYTKLDPSKRTPANQHMAVFLLFAGQPDNNIKRLCEVFDVETGTINLILKRVTYYISSLRQQYIKWPGEEEKLKASKHFEECGFTKAIGCIGCTYITLRTSEYLEDECIDRHGNISLCLQGACDERKKFIDVFCGYRGSSSANWVYVNSTICQNLEEKCGDYYLLGNSAYPCGAHLITPYFRNRKLSEKEDTFNTILLGEHLNIRTAFCMLKQRFRQLQFCRLLSHQLQVHFILACCVLHNMANDDDFDFGLTYKSEEYDPSFEEYRSDKNFDEENKLRDAIAEEFE